MLPETQKLLTQKVLAIPRLSLIFSHLLQEWSDILRSSGYRLRNGNARESTKLFIDFKAAYDSERKMPYYNILIKFGIPTKSANQSKVRLD
jgi:hypothetical protein